MTELLPEAQLFGAAEEGKSGGHTDMGTMFWRVLAPSYPEQFQN